MTATTTIDLLRHGQTQGDNCYRGSTEIPLTEQGLRQMNDTVADIECWEAVISSPLSRCLNFARLLAEHRHIPLTIEPGFRELDFGLWEGKNAEQICRTEADALMKFYNDPLRHPPPGGESIKDFQQRIVACWRNMITAHQGEHILLVTHAGVIRMLLAWILGMPVNNMFRIQVEHANLSRIRCFDDGKSPYFQLTFHGK